MEIRKKNIHMDRMKSSASTQITIDADVNVPDSKPDVVKILLEKSRVKIEEVKAFENQVNIQGNLCYSFLYRCENEDRNISSMDGKIPFEEMVHVEGAESLDTVKVQKQLESMSIEIINSRKINVRALLFLKPEIEELYDEEILSEIEPAGMLQTKKTQLFTTQTYADKKDLFRINEEIRLPNSLPNIFELIWDQTRISTLDFRAENGKLIILGDIQLFILYEAEGEDGKLSFYETKLPVNTEIDCSDCVDTLIPLIEYEIGDMQLEIKPDEDGEDRIIELNMNVEMNLKLLNEVKTEIIDDVYGITEEVSGVFQKGQYRKLIGNEKGKCISSGNIKIHATKLQTLQICAATGNLIIDDMQINSGEIRTEGAVDLQLLYMDVKDQKQLYAEKGSIPFSCKLEMKEANADTSVFLDAVISQITVSLPDNEEAEITVQINMHLFAFQNRETDFLKDIKISSLNAEKMKSLPSMVGYIAREGDTLWNLGKKYYVSIDQIIESNQLKSQELKKGDKLMIIKSMGKEHS